METLKDGAKEEGAEERLQEEAKEEKYEGMECCRRILEGCLKTQRRAGIVGQMLKPSPAKPASHMGTGSSPRCSTFDPIPC